MKDTAIRIPGMYAITPDRPLDAYAERLEQLLADGLSLVQYRRKQGAPDEREREAGAILQWCRRAGCPLLINDDVELALRIAADGVHLGRDDMTLAQARRVLGPEALIGASAYADLARACRLREAGADYVAFGRFFPSASKPHATPAPLSILGQARPLLDCPIVAIGGIQPGRVAEVHAAGADLCAMIDGLFG